MVIQEYFNTFTRHEYGKQKKIRTLQSYTVMRNEGKQRLYYTLKFDSLCPLDGYLEQRPTPNKDNAFRRRPCRCTRNQILSLTFQLRQRSDIPDRALNRTSSTRRSEVFHYWKLRNTRNFRSERLRVDTKNLRARPLSTFCKRGGKKESLGEGESRRWLSSVTYRHTFFFFAKHVTQVLTYTSLPFVVLLVYDVYTLSCFHCMNWNVLCIRFFKVSKFSSNPSSRVFKS